MLVCEYVDGSAILPTSSSTITKKVWQLQLLFEET